MTTISTSERFAFAPSIALRRRSLVAPPLSALPDHRLVGRVGGTVVRAMPSSEGALEHRRLQLEQRRLAAKHRYMLDPSLQNGHLVLLR